MTTDVIHDRHLERARRIVVATLEAGSTPARLSQHLAVAFQAAADALHEEADAATEARKKGHQSLSKDLRNTAGRIVGIAQDLLELSKLEAPAPPPPPPPTDDDRLFEKAVEFQRSIGANPINAAWLRELAKEGLIDENGEPMPVEPYTPTTDSVISESDVAAHLATLEAERAATLHTPPLELDDATRTHLEQVKSYLRGDTNEPPSLEMPPGMPDPCQPIGCDNGYHLPGCVFAERDATEDPRRGGPVEQYDNPSTGDREIMPPLHLAFEDPEPYRPASRPPFPGAEKHRYDYATLMTPVPAERFPDHWSWSQLTSMEDCGLKHRGQRLDGIPQQPQWTQVGGHTFHAVTEAFDRGAWRAGGADLLPEVHPELIKQRWEIAFKAEIDLTAQESGIVMGEDGGNWRASSGGKEGYTFWLIEGERMLEIYVHNRRKLDKAAREAGTLATPLELMPHVVTLNAERVLVIEYPYQRTVAGPLGELTVHGVIDRAYRCADGTILIKDLKSGRMDGDSGQLGEYAWAIVDMIQGGPQHTGVPFDGTIKACFYDARKGLFTDPIDVLERHPREEYVYRYHAAEAARRGGVFMPRRSSFCNGCSIRYACPVGGA